MELILPHTVLDMFFLTKRIYLILAKREVTFHSPISVEVLKVINEY